MHRSVSTSRSQSRVPRNQSGVRDTSVCFVFIHISHKYICIHFFISTLKYFYYFSDAIET